MFSFPACYRQLLQKGRNLQAAFQAVKNTVLQSGARDAVVTWEGSTNIYPFYLRSAPFLLFSDPDGRSGNHLSTGPGTLKEACI